MSCARATITCFGCGIPTRTLLRKIKISAGTRQSSLSRLGVQEPSDLVIVSNLFGDAPKGFVRLDAEGAEDRDEFQHIDPTLTGLNPCDQGLLATQLLRELRLSHALRAARVRDRLAQRCLPVCVYSPRHSVPRRFSLAVA